jgi:hypothetical protein
MTILDATTEFLAPLTGRRKSPLSIAREPARAPLIEKKLATARARLSQLMSGFNDLAFLAASEDTPGPKADAFAALKRDIDSAEATIADLEAALASAQAFDEAQERAQKAAVRRADLNIGKRHLAKRDAAAEKFTAAMTQAVAAYREMVVEAGKAYTVLQPFMGGDVVRGARFTKNELHRDCALEIMRLSVDYPKTAGSDADPAFPNNQAIVGVTRRSALQTPLADSLKDRSASLIDHLTGKQADQ